MLTTCLFVYIHMFHSLHLPVALHPLEHTQRVALPFGRYTAVHINRHTATMQHIRHSTMRTATMRAITRGGWMVHAHPPSHAAALNAAVSIRPSTIRRVHANASHAASPPSPSPSATPASPSSSSPAFSRSFDPSALRGVLTDLHQRGMLADMTHSAELIQHLNTPDPKQPGKIISRSIYAGFDPTASSLHLGNLLVLMVLRRFQHAGHKPICVVGGATGMIGDPSGRSTERNMMTEEDIQKNIKGISADIRKFLTFECENADSDSNVTTHATATDSPAATSHSRLLNNAGWFAPINVIRFFRDVGRHFRMGVMLSKDSVSSRLSNENGMSFTEFTYQVLQAYDFMHLYKHHNVSIQIGGTDQWGNITAGVDLIKRDAAANARAAVGVAAAAAGTTGEPEVFGLTLPLLTTASGQKFGKSMGNAPVWLSAPNPSLPSTGQACTSSPYQLYQHFLSTADADLERFLKLFTDLSIDDIATLCSSQPPKVVARRLAEEVTRLVHGEAGLKMAQDTSEALFSKEKKLDAIHDMATLLTLMEGVPQVHMPLSSLVGGSIVDLTMKLGLAKTKSEVKRLIAAGGLYINADKVTSEAYTIAETDLIVDRRACVIRAGKKKQGVILVQEAN